MAVKKSWLSFLKRVFISEAKPKTEKKSKKWRWIFRRHKSNKLPALGAPEKALHEARKEQKKHALTVAIATATAAEAAVAAAHAAAEVVRLAAASESYKHWATENHILAATKIQAAFRGCLARKALRALKCLVKLQAVVRGRAVRRQLCSSLKCLPSIRIKYPQKEGSELCIVNASSRDHEKELLLGQEKVLAEKAMKPKDSNSQRSWDHSILSKEDLEAICLRKQEAIIKRERMKRYSFSYQEGQCAKIPEQRNAAKECDRRYSWLDQWDRERIQMDMSKSSVHSVAATDNICAAGQLKQRYMQKQDPLGLNLPYLLPRRSCSHAKQNSIGQDAFFPNSPIFPTFMAATESTKLKARSFSTPKQRLGYFDACFDPNSPGKKKIPCWSTYNGASAAADGKGCPSQKMSISMQYQH